MDWINVKNQMPEPMEWVLGYTATGRYEVVRYDHIMDDWDRVISNYCLSKGSVTHWKPLPEPPTE